MTCYTPLRGYKSKDLTEKGKRQIVFSREKGLYDQPVVVPCGQCDGCKKTYTRNWAIRCMHEAATWKDNAFLTLTYNEENLPVNGTLEPETFTNFMKYLREHYGPGVRFYGCGEYGEKGQRPHYHILLFNVNITDKELYGINNGHQLYTSETIERLWKRGFHQIGEVTWESASYTARYVMKKVPERKNPDEYLLRAKEFVRMSRRPGIGTFFYNKYKEDIWNTDSVIVNKRTLTPPKFYQDKLEKENEKKLEEIKTRRVRKTKPVTDRRLNDMYNNQQIRKKKFSGKRSYENAT